MIGKPQWFVRRKYSGWGVNPKTWQGWVYIAVVILPFVIFQAVPFWNTTVRVVISVIWFLVLAIDMAHIMSQMKRDERERIHEAIAERNAIWIMIVILSIGIAYQVASSAVTQTVKVDPFLIAALIFGFVVKAISNIYLEKHD